MSTLFFLNYLDEFSNMAVLQLINRGMVKYTPYFLNFPMLKIIDIVYILPLHVHLHVEYGK